jgi:hypothetical protein
MRIFQIILIILLTPFAAISQNCSQVYTFNSSDKATYSTTCGIQEGKDWMVNKNSCNFYTPLTPAGGQTGEPVKTIDLSLRLSNSGNLDEKDFAWIFYYVNGKIEETKTIRGDQAETVIDFRDSIRVPAGGNFKLRIAFVCDEQDEFWKLGNGDLSLCVRAITGEPFVKQESNNNISAYREREIVKLNWNASSGPMANYFLIERSKNGSQFEFAGYVKDNRSTQESHYSFIDAAAPKAETWYRITKIDLKGNSEPFGDFISVK